MGEPGPVGGHAIDAGNGAEGANVLVRAQIAHHPHGLHRQQHRKGLPDLIVEPIALQLVNEDRVGLAQQVQRLTVDRPQHTHGQAGAGERMPPDDRRRHA